MQIHLAAKRGDNLVIERQLRRGVRVDAKDEEGKTPLMCAAEGHRSGVATLQLLVSRGASVNEISGSLQETPLALAAKSGRPEKVQFLLEAGAAPHFVNESGYTAITNIPVWRDAGHIAVLETLLKAGADPNVITEYGECPLRVALRTGHFSAIRLLLSYGADRAPAKMTDLMWAIALESFEGLNAEMRSNADLAARNYWDMTPWLLSRLTGDVAKAKLLLDSGANVSDRGRCGQTNLMYPVSCDHVEMTSWLIAQGADVHATDEFGHTALYVAAMSGAVGCVDVLLESGANLELPDGDPIVTEAANLATVQAFKKSGATIDAVASGGYWLLRTAAELGDVEFARELLLLGASPHTTSTGATALHTAVGGDHLEIVGMLLQYGADPNVADVDGWTPLMYAGSLECVNLLLDARGDVHARDDSDADVAQHHRDPEILDRLQEVGATVHPRQGSLRSLLHSAAEDGDLGLLEYLLRQEVDVNVATSWGLTPLMAAAERGHTDVMKHLLAGGANVHACDENGRTVLFYSASPEAFTAFQLMQEYSGVELRRTLHDAAGEILDDIKEVVDQIAPSLNYGYYPSDDVTGIDLLVSAGARVDDRDAEGATPLLVACRCGRPARVEKLIQLGANPRVCDSSGKSAHEVLVEHHDPDQREKILRLLEDNT